MSAPDATPSPAPPLALLEVLERDGRVRRALPVRAWPLAIGRAIDNDVVLDDPHVAPHHAVLEEAPAGGAPQLRALASVNGVAWGRRRLHDGQTAAFAAGADGGFVVGTTRLRLRLAGEALAPERMLARAPRHAATLLLLALLWAWLLAEQAIVLDPGSKPSQWVLPLLVAPALLLLWCLLWALASKLFQHRFDYGPHLDVAARGLLAIQVVSLALPWLSALTNWAAPSRLAGVAAAGCAALMLLAHARLVLPHARRALGVAALAAYALGLSVLFALNLQRHERWFAELYVSVLPPPALLWAQPVARDAFVGAHADRLRAALARAARDDDGDGGADGDDE